jgi:hypothetical protein
MLHWTSSYRPKSHAWRRSLAFDGKHENRDAPQKFTLGEVLDELDKVKDVRPGKPVNKLKTLEEKGSVMWVQRFIATNLCCGGCLIGYI